MCWLVLSLCGTHSQLFIEGSCQSQHWQRNKCYIICNVALVVRGSRRKP